MIARLDQTMGTNTHVPQGGDLGVGGQKLKGMEGSRGTMRGAIFALLLSLASLPVTAAEGLTFLTAYLSDPLSLTEAMVKACTSRHTELAPQGATALQSWRERNAADARRAVRLTAQKLEKLPQSREEIQRTLAQLRQEHLEGWQRVAAFPTACSDYLASLERPESDLARHLP